ncbi:hypothetical protein [Gemmobacter sp.]|uniref:calcium-binding protein n=1 Tax=Gemmobacter sp. TaxID=1898957 RepID=UPI0025B80F1B|nr:hypothetical protein [Gemmobacter sp.]
MTQTVFRFNTATNMAQLNIEALHDTAFSVAMTSGAGLSVAGIACDSVLTFATEQGDLILGGAGLQFSDGKLTGGTVSAIAFDSAPGFAGLDLAVLPISLQATDLQAHFDGTASLTLLQELMGSPLFVRGSGKADRLLGGEFDDILRGGEGHDRLSGRAGEDLLVGGLGADRLAGGADDDRLEGGRGTDVLRGESGDDDLRGGSRADRLEGGRGDDSLFGGSGADVLVFRNHDGSDTITGFTSGVDEVQILLRPSDPQNIELAFEYRDGRCIVTFLDVTLTFEATPPGSLNFAEGGDFTLVAL